MLRQKPHERLVLFGTENLTWMIFHDEFVAVSHPVPSPRVSVAVTFLSNSGTGRPTRPSDFAITLLVRVTTVCCRSMRPSELPTGEQDSSFIRNLRRPWN